MKMSGHLLSKRVDIYWVFRDHCLMTYRRLWWGEGSCWSLYCGYSLKVGVARSRGIGHCVGELWDGLNRESCGGSPPERSSTFEGCNG